MITFYAQFDGHNGPRSTGDHLVKFTVEKEHMPMLYSHLEELEKNPSVVIRLEVVKTVADAQKILDENSAELKNKLNKKIHLLIDKIAVRDKDSPEDIKFTIKTKLKVSSLSELTVDQQEELLKYLEDKLVLS